MRKKSDPGAKEASSSTAPPPPSKASSSQESKRSTPSRSNTLLWTKKPVCEEPEEISTRPVPSRSKTLGITDSSFWSLRSDTKDSEEAKDDKKGKSVARPSNPKAKSETVVTRKNRSESVSAAPRSHAPDSHNEGTSHLCFSFPLGTLDPDIEFVPSDDHSTSTSLAAERVYRA